MEGYISQYKKSNQNAFDKEVFLILYYSILNECFKLIEDGCRGYLADKEKVFIADETQITAGIYNHIDIIITNQKLPFDIVTEFYIYSKDIKLGKKNPKKAKRFDLRIFTWDKSNGRFRFGVEAKLLSENNFDKKIANNLIKEYVEDAGMGKFIKNLYDPESYNIGVMLGQIINGTVENIKNRINDKIRNIHSDNECLIKNNDNYISNYSDNGIRKDLHHIFFDFSKAITEN